MDMSGAPAYAPQPALEPAFEPQVPPQILDENRKMLYVPQHEPPVGRARVF